MTSTAPRPRRSDALRQRLRPRPALRLQRSLPSPTASAPAVGPSLQVWEVRGPNAVRSALLGCAVRGQLRVHAMARRSPASGPRPFHDLPQDRGALLLAEVLPAVPTDSGAPSAARTLAPGQRSLAARRVHGARAPRFLLRQRCRARLAQLGASASASVSAAA